MSNGARKGTVSRWRVWTGLLRAWTLLPISGPLRTAHCMKYFMVLSDLQIAEQIGSSSEKPALWTKGRFEILTTVRVAACPAYCIYYVTDAPLAWSVASKALSD